MDPLAKRRLLFGIYAAEERDDFEAFVKRNLWIRTKAGPIIPYRLNPIQKLYRSMKAKALAEGKPPRFIVLKYRRGGITTEEQAESYHLTCNREGQHCVTLAHDADTTEEIFGISTLFWERMDPMRRPKRRAKNKRELDFPALRSRFYTGTAGTEGFGRGATFQRVHGSEVAKWPKGIRGFRDLMAGLTEATSEGEIVLESTANGFGNGYQVTYYEAMKGGNEWTPIFLAWFMDPLNRFPLEAKEKIKFSREEKALIKRNAEWFTRPEEQIKWRRATVRRLKELFPQEYPEDWVTAFVVTGSLFFSAEILRDLMPLCRKPLTKEQLVALDCPKELLDGITVWHPPGEGMKAFIGADSSEGIEGGDNDPSHAGVIDLEGRQCASLHGYWKPEVFGRHICKLGKWYRKAVLAIEVKEHGHSVMNTVRNECHYPNLYRHRDYDQRGGSAKIGWDTNGKTRPIMLDDLREATHEGFLEVNDEDYIGECFTFQDDGKGKFKARSGTHDDTIFGWGIAWQARKKGDQSAGYRGLGDRPDMPPEEEEEKKGLDGPGFVPLKT